MWEQQVGERVSQIRKNRNLTRAEFGQLISLSERHVGKIERGNTITVESIVKICKKIGVSADYIIFGSHDPMATVATLNDLTYEQVQVTLDIAMNVIKFLSTETGNNALIQEVFRQQNPFELMKS
jgi:transcriptional regulator with XRE-family HTH domain